MNLTALKTYAPQARKDFIQAMKDRAAFYGITEKKTEPIIEKGNVAVISGREFPRSVATKRTALEKRINEGGFHQTMEALAYTWFNRFVAIRYMELHGYLDHGYRVLSPAKRSTTDNTDNTDPKSKHSLSAKSVLSVVQIPEILEHAEHIDLPGIDKNTIIDLKLAGHKESELYRLLLIAQCNALHSSMPFLFERIDDETELLLPDNLLSSDSLIRSLVTNLDAEDCESVEVLGWLYQFYISEKKDTVMARKSAVPTEDIPAVTQLFTPHWIVRYLVENSLGRLWLLNRPSSRLREHMPYYIEGEAETDFLIINKPEEIKLLDPACGSGHMLTYSFDLLNLIYEEEGYAPTEIPALILRHNLHGLEICPRAAQLAELALIFKAREKSRRFFQPEHLVRPRIIELRDVRFTENELRDYFKAIGIASDSQLTNLLHQFEEAKTFGSLIQPCLDEQAIANLRCTIEGTDLGGQLFLRETHLKVLRVLEQAEALTQRYHVVAENPPYCGSRYMNPAIASLAKGAFKDGSADMFAMFILRSTDLLESGGYLAVVCPFVWMFIATYEGFRRQLLSRGTFQSMVRLEYNAFEPACVPVSAWIIRKGITDRATCTFIDLSDFKGIENQSPKTLEAIHDPSVPFRFKADCSDFLKIPTASFGYSVSPVFRDSFAAKQKLGDVTDFTGSQNITGKNHRFVRLWWEIGLNSVGPDHRWVFYSKGGGNRKWWGLLEDVVDWSEGARLFYKQNKTSNLLDRRYWFRPGVTYSMLTSNQATFRLLPASAVYDKGGPTFHANEPDLDLVLLALCNSPYADRVFDVLNPTLNLQVQDVKNVPLITVDKSTVRRLTDSCVSIARTDWDNFETSWDFRDQPLLRPGLKGATLEASWQNWEAQSTAAIRRMQELETENNRLFINAYGLTGELQPEVPEDQITLARADVKKDIAAFLSYAVGCMMGRYSPDYPGLILANAGDTLREFPKKVGRPMAELSFAPDEDGIIPVLNQDWGIADDATARVVEFINVLWPKEYLEENLFFISQSLGATPKDPSREVIRNYFSTSFYKDHLQKYKKRPIYWLFSSGKLRAFQCLVYLHRYNEGTLSRMRTEYVIPIQSRIVGRIEQLEGDKLKATSTSHRKKLQKEQDDMKKQQEELKSFEEKLKHAAERKIKLDLDDGVKVNYAKFTDKKYGEILAEVKAICGTKDED